MPDFVAPQLCRLVDRPPAGEGWCHEIKFDGYRVQLRVEGGKATLKTRKGLDWTDKFGAIAKEGSTLPDVLIDGEIVALDHDGAPDFSTLQAAISDGKTDGLIFFAFDLLFAGGEDLRPLPLAERKARLKRLLEARPKGEGETDPLCRAFRERRRRRTAIGVPAVAGRHRVKEAQRTLSLRPLRQLDQGQVPRRPRGGDRRLENHQRQVPLADGRRPSRRPSCLCRNGRHRLRAGQGAADHAGAEGRRFRSESVRRQGRAAQDPRRALAQARTGRRDRIRGLYRRRQYHGRLPSRDCGRTSRPTK